MAYKTPSSDTGDRFSMAETDWPRARSRRLYAAICRVERQGESCRMGHLRESDPQASHVQPTGGDRSGPVAATQSADERGGTTPYNLLPISTGGQPGGAQGHPATTPYEVAAWWCRYILPPGGVLLDPFCGSGTMLVAGLDNAASKVIVIDREKRYLAIARRRVSNG
jgi:hypothetical protein